MKLALTVATLIALGGGTAHAQQGQLSLGQRDLTPEEQQVIMDAVRHRYAIPGQQNTIGQSFQQWLPRARSITARL